MVPPRSDSRMRPAVERMRDVRAVLFDFDGTLVDTIPHILASFRHATQEVLGAALPDEVLLHSVGIPLARQMRLLVDDEETAERLLASYRRFNHAHHDEMARLYPNTVPTLEALRELGTTMGVVTSKSAPVAGMGIRLFDLARFFGVVVTADDTELHKPDPAPIVFAAEVLGIDARQCLYVGDAPADIEAGRAAGAATAAALWGVASRDRLEAAAPDFLLADIGNVLDLVRAGNPRLG